jgi:hypothetical protein
MMKSACQLPNGSDELIKMGTKIWVPMYGGLRDLILKEAHKFKYLMHPGSNKMYYSLKDHYWWPGMKRDIAGYIENA